MLVLCLLCWVVKFQCLGSSTLYLRKGIPAPTRAVEAMVHIRGLSTEHLRLSTSLCSHGVKMVHLTPDIKEIRLF